MNGSFYTHNNTWRQKGIKTNLGRKQYRLIKNRWGALGDSDRDLDGIMLVQRDAIEYTPNDTHPVTTQFLPFNWWIVCAGSHDLI